MKRRSEHKGRAGLTLLEVLISFVVLAMILGAVGVVTLSGKAAYDEGMSAAVLEAQGRRALARIAEELKGARKTTLSPNPTPPTGASSLQFQTSTGYSGGAQQWSTDSAIQFERDPLDTNNGLDDDGDGLIDECRVVLVRDVGLASEIRAILVNRVGELLQGETVNGTDDNGNGLRDEGGLSFVVDGNGMLTVRMTLEARDPKNLLVRRTIETSIALRN